jgi:hypothetical protein
MAKLQFFSCAGHRLHAAVMPHCYSAQRLILGMREWQTAGGALHGKRIGGLIRALSCRRQGTLRVARMLRADMRKSAFPKALFLMRGRPDYRIGPDRDWLVKT